MKVFIVYLCTTFLKRCLSPVYHSVELVVFVFVFDFFCLFFVLPR